MLVAASQSGTPSSFEEMFLLSAGGPFAWITLALGIGVFVVAMIFDMSDPHRVTRRSADALQLADGIACHAVIKAVSVAPGDIGGGSGG